MVLAMRRNSKQRDAKIERHHYTSTAHESQPVRSNSPAESRRGQGRLNTMANRKHGGPSMFYRDKEGYGYGY